MEVPTNSVPTLLESRRNQPESLRRIHVDTLLRSAYAPFEWCEGAKVEKVDTFPVLQVNPVRL